MEGNKIDLEKVKNWYIEAFAWYKVLKIFREREWVDRDDITHLAHRSVSSATAPLKKLGFEFKKRKQINGEGNRVTQYSISHVPKNFKNTKA